MRKLLTVLLVFGLAGCGGSSGDVASPGTTPPKDNTQYSPFRQCPDGTTVRKPRLCPTPPPPPPPPPTQECWDGSVILLTETCPEQPPAPEPTQTCWDGSVIPVSHECPTPPPPPPPPPETQTCPDGTVIPASDECPVIVPPPPPPPPDPVWVPAPLKVGGYARVLDQCPNALDPFRRWPEFFEVPIQGQAYKVNSFGLTVRITGEPLAPLISGVDEAVTLEVGDGTWTTVLTSCVEGIAIQQ